MDLVVLYLGLFVYSVGIGGSNALGLKARVSLLEIQMNRDAYRTKSDIMDLRTSVDNLNASVNLCFEPNDNTETEERESGNEISEKKANVETPFESERFRALASAFVDEKLAMRRTIEELQEQVMINKDAIYSMGVERKNMNTAVRELMDRTQEINSVFTISTHENAQRISEVEKNLLELKSQTELYFKETRDLARELQTIRETTTTRTTSTTVTTTTQPVIKECPSGWTVVSGRDTCYFHITETLDWTSAIQHCHSLGGKLAEPDTKQKFDTFINLFGKKGPWIGASDRKNEGVYVWHSSNKPVENIPWKPGQPNNYGGDQDCINIWDSALSDEDCYYKMNIICEITLG